MKNRLVILPLLSCSLLLTSCIFSFGDNGEWKKQYGTPELLLENAINESYVYLYENQNQFKDEGNVVRDAIKEAAPFTSIDNHSVPQEYSYFTYEAMWMAATSGPNYEHLSIWANGFVRIDHKTSLGPHEYLYFSISEAKAKSLVDLVFSKAIQ